jgi:uncharacterized membrane protein (UPF0127 family)
MKYNIIGYGLGLGLIVVMVGMLGWWLSWSQWGEDQGEVIETKNPITERRQMKVGETTLKVEVRNTSETRALGLSYRKSLGEDEGMVFIFPQVGRYPFWMKGMEFDLDMIWIKDNMVVGVSPNILAPKNNEGEVITVTPPAEANMILEVRGGWAEKQGIMQGDRVDIEYPPVVY